MAEPGAVGSRVRIRLSISPGMSLTGTVTEIEGGQLYVYIDGDMAPIPVSRDEVRLLPTTSS